MKDMDDSRLIPVSDKLYIVDTPTRGKFPMAYSFLVMGTDTRALIDTGCGPDACRHILREYDVDLIINSHCHPDHISGNHLFSGKELIVPQERVDETGTVDRLAYRLVGPDPEVMDSWKKFACEGVGLADYEPTGTFKDGDILNFGGISLQAIHTPGHLADHYCFLEPKEDVLLSFDVDLTGIGPFYGNPEADIGEFRESMSKIMDLQPKVVASSHRLPVKDNVMEELASFTQKIDRNEKRVLKAMDVPRTFEEILALKPIFGKYLPGLDLIYSFFEGHMISKHLECMEQEGVIARMGGKFVRVHSTV